MNQNEVNNLTMPHTKLVLRISCQIANINAVQVVRDPIVDSSLRNDAKTRSMWRIIVMNVATDDVFHLCLGFGIDVEANSGRLQELSKC